MSEFKKTRDVATYQKLAPPKSLQGEEDAEVTWDLIVQRYPNAAPLLCQMETVIERAEGLLDQLRSPQNDPPERSGSFGIADAEDELMGPCNVNESTEVSMISDQDSRLASDENMTPEIDSLSLADKTSDDYHEENAASEEVFYIEDRAVGEASLDVSSASMVQSDSKFPPVPEDDIKGSCIGRKEGPESGEPSVRNVTEIAEKFSEEITLGGKSSSLEAWGKVVGENLNQTKHLKTAKGCSSGSISAEEDSVSEHARRLSDLRSGPMQQMTKLNVLGKKDELMQRFVGTIATASKVVDTARAVDRDQDEVQDVEPAPKSAEKKINESGERAGGSAVKISQKVEETGENNGALSKSVKNDEVQGNGDEVAAAPRSAVEILEEYSQICGANVEYKNLSPSCSYNKNIVVKCCFNGFAFDACAQGKKIAKKDAAAKLLRCLAGRQIDGGDMKGLTQFTRKQIEEIISLGNGGESETAVRKLYKICLELNAPEPAYTVHQDTGIVGNRYTVKCAALGLTTSGYGIRELVAKRVAADELLHNYHKNRTSAN